MERWNYNGGNVLLLLDKTRANGTAALATQLVFAV